MFGIGKKKNEEAGGQDKMIGAKLDLGGIQIDESKIKTIPEKFLPSKQMSGGKYNAVIIVIVILIVIVGTFTALLTFSESFSEMIFGKKIETVEGGDLLDSSTTDEVSTSTTGEETGDTAEAQAFRKEVLSDTGEFVGAISFLMRKELEYVDLRTSATLPDKEEIIDSSNNKFKIIGGVYAFDPGGTKLADGNLKIEIFYNNNQLGEYKAADLKVLNWEKEPEIDFIAGTVKGADSKVELEVGVLPKGKIALAVLTETTSELSATSTSNEDIEPVGALPSTTDTDDDGLTDDEEKLYGMDSAKSDSNGDGKTDKDEVLSWYQVNSGEKADSHLKVLDNKGKGYIIYYPATWTTEGSTSTASTTADEEKAFSFVAPTGEMIQIMVKANPQGLSPKEWYLKQTGESSDSQIKTGQINGLDAAWSWDQFTSYVAKDKEIYLITYNTGLKEEASFKTTFLGMVGSFHFPELLVKSYKYENKKYGFSIELPIAWKDYDVYDYTKDWGAGLKSNSLMFRLPTKYKEECNGYEKCATFIIDVFDSKTWDKVRLLDNAPLLVNVNDNYVFAYHKNDVYGSDLEEQMQGVDDIMATFVFVK